MKQYNQFNNQNKKASEKAFTIGFIVIFALCFLPFALKGTNKNDIPSEPAAADHPEVSGGDISGPYAADDIPTVHELPGIKFNYSEDTDFPLSDDMLMSEAALLYDKDTNTILYSKNADKALYPASTTKIMTAYVALKHLSPDHKLKAGTELTLLQPESSLAYLKQGSILTLEDALYALMLPSGNDAAYIIAANTARAVSGEPDMNDADAIKYFSRLMNAEAMMAGANRTHFCVPDGYHDPFHYTTAEDLLRISLKTDEYPLLSEIVLAPYRETKIISGEAFFWSNGNCLVVNDNGYYLPYATGFKTGFTDEAGYCMVATASKDNRNLIAVTMNSPTLAGRYTDAAKLFYSVLEPEKLIEPAETTAAQTAVPLEEQN